MGLLKLFSEWSVSDDYFGPSDLYLEEVFYIFLYGYAAYKEQDWLWEVLKIQLTSRMEDGVIDSKGNNLNTGVAVCFQIFPHRFVRDEDLLRVIVDMLQETMHV